MATVVYVSNADSGDISVLALDEGTGDVSTLQTLPLGGTVMPLALSPDRRVLYAARRSDPLAVVAMAIDASSGRLSPLGEAPLPASMAHLAVDATGRWLFSASYGGNLVAVNALHADGTPGAVRQQVPTGPKAHCMRAAPGNRHVFATSLGAGVVLQFNFDAHSGLLTPNDPPALALRAASGPRHLAFHPQAPFVMLLNELDASLDVLALDRTQGTLSLLHTVSTLPGGFSGEPWAAELRFTPDGRHLYTSERRSGTLAIFAVDANSGLPTLLGHAATQPQPRGFAITPSGRYLVAAGQASHRVSVHALRPSTGTLSLVAEHPVGRNPNWVEAIQLP
ncbi:MAG: lactonase family protein [Rhizobacter sp.]|nr:lactonase family protein [Rhizobacter sp.]